MSRPTCDIIASGGFRKSVHENTEQLNVMGACCCDVLDSQEVLIMPGLVQQLSDDESRTQSLLIPCRQRALF